MSVVECLVSRYRTTLQNAWNPSASAAERFWFLVYPPAQERRLRAYQSEFETTTRQADCAWVPLDITDDFGLWLGRHEYRDTYFESPEWLAPALEEFGEALLDKLRPAVQEESDGMRRVVALTGLGALFGLRRASWLIEELAPAVGPQTRVLAFFPGSHEHHNYRLLDARDGWDYLAVPIKC